MTVFSKTSNEKKWMSATQGIGIRALNPAVVVGVPAHGVVPVSMLTDPLVPLVVQITRTPEMEDGDSIQLHWNNDVIGEGFGEIIDVLPTDPPAKVYELEIPVSFIPALYGFSTNLLDYEVGDIYTGSSIMAGLPVPVTFDRLTPGGLDAPGALLFTDEQAHEITLSDLVNNQLPVEAAAWDDMRVGDILTPWLGTSTAEASGSYLAPMPAVVAADLHHKFPVKFELADMMALGNVVQYFGYKLEDLAGNVSLLSVPIHASVLLTAPPGNLTAPNVPANDDGVVSDADVRPTPVVVEIPRYDNAAVGDWITVVWGTIEMPAVQLNASHFPTPPDPASVLVSISLPYTEVARGPVTAPALQVTYKVRVGTIEAGTSAAATINVDLSTPGGIPDPDPTTPWHEDLALPTLISGGGETDVISPVDFDKDAVINIPRLGASSNQPIWASGDELTVTYNTTELTMVPITGSNVGNDPLVVPLPRATISLVGPGVFGVTYRIRRALTPPLTPPQFSTANSAPKSVTVRSSTEYPNNGEPLRVVAFPEAKVVQGNRYIQRREGRDGTPVRVDVTYPNVVGGQATLDLRFVGLTGFNNEAGAELADTEFLVTAQPISAADVTRGWIEIEIPAEILLKICNRNGSKTTHSITNSSGPTNSLETFMNIAVEHKDPNFACIFPVPPGETL